MRGARRGDRVLLIGDNSFFWVAAYLGILRAGLVCVPLPGNISAADLAYIIETTDARVGFIQSQRAKGSRTGSSCVLWITDDETNAFIDTASRNTSDQAMLQDQVARDRIGNSQPEGVGGADVYVWIYRKTPRGDGFAWQHSCEH